MTPKEYEKAVVEHLRVDWPPPLFEVRHDVKLHGARSLRRRQVDVSVWQAGASEPFMIIEAKKRSRPVDVGTAGMTIALLHDIGKRLAVMVSTKGVSSAGRNYLSAEGIDHITITLVDALSLSWIPEIEKRFGVDREFKRVSGEMVEALRTGRAEVFLNVDEVPFEEWCAVVEVGLSRFPLSASKVLMAVAEHHEDDGHRFNAVMFLSDFLLLDNSAIARLLLTETDEDILDLLNHIVGHH